MQHFDQDIANVVEFQEEVTRVQATVIMAEVWTTRVEKVARRVPSCGLLLAGKLAG
jgi:hypothetical protein